MGRQNSVVGFLQNGLPDAVLIQFSGVGASVCSKAMPMVSESDKDCLVNRLPWPSPCTDKDSMEKRQA